MLDRLALAAAGDNSPWRGFGDFNPAGDDYTWFLILMAAVAVVWVVSAVALVIAVIWLLRRYGVRAGALTASATGRGASEQSARPGAPTDSPTGAPAETLPGAPAETPLQILERRYAAGDIDRDEFLQRKTDLTG